MNKDFLAAVSFYETRVIGSYNDPAIQYKTDIDLQEIIRLRVPVQHPGVLDALHAFFVRIFDFCEKTPGCIITDFKMGQFGAHVPIRWTAEDVRRGYIDYDALNRKTFADLLQTRSIIKIDFILRDKKNVLQEVSKNFYIIYSNADTTPIEMINENIYISLLRDYYKYKAAGDIYKARKRLYSYFKHSNNQSGMRCVLQYLNDPAHALPYLQKYKDGLLKDYIAAAKPSDFEVRKIRHANRVSGAAGPASQAQRPAC
jgi:hypothetical protein